MLFFLAFGYTGAAAVKLAEIHFLDTGEVNLTWEGSASEFYQVEVAPRLGAPFTPITGVIPGQLRTSYTDPTIDLARRFYRVSTIDPDAAAYVDRASIEAPFSIRSLSAWIGGLKDLGLYDHAVYLTTLHRLQNGGEGSKVFAIKGPTGTLLGFPQWTGSGLTFSANGSVELVNPFPQGPLSEFSLLAVFDSDQSPLRMVFGSQGSLTGPALLAGGSASQGIDPNALFFDYTADGFTPPPNFGEAGRRTFVKGNTGASQISLATFSATNISCQTGMDLRFHTDGKFPPAWNENAHWRIGARLDDQFPFVGTISLAAAFDVAITDAQFDQIRRLYGRTIGASVALPRVNVMIEGDSLSEESVIVTWGELLFQQPNWKGKFNKRNVARGGEIVADMLEEFPSQVLPYADQPGRNYLFIWGGAREIKQRSGEQAFEDLERYWAMGRAAGYKVVAFTILPYGGPTSPVAPHRQKLNELIRAADKQYDYLIDVNEHPLLQDPNNSTYYRPDGVHLWETGNQLIAELINRVISDP